MAKAFSVDRCPSVKRGSDQTGDLPGDLITEAGQQKLKTLSELDDRIAEAEEAGRKSLLLLVRRAGDPRFVALSLEE